MSARSGPLADEPDLARAHLRGVDENDDSSRFSFGVASVCTVGGLGSPLTLSL